MRDPLRILALGAILASCGGKAPAPSAPAAAGAASPSSAGKGAPSRLLYEVTPSRLFPELVGQRGIVATEEGQQRVLVDRMRLVARADGSLERAAELLPNGSVASTALPSRLGGGYLFHVNAGGGTEIWRAAGWLDKLRPLTRRGEVVSDIVPGFDRLYVRLSTGNRIIALDARTGDQMSVGPLPTAGSYGALAFADGWRAVVDTDLRGPLATFDAGLTWRPLNLGERPQGVGIFDGDPAVLVAGGRYVVDARGGVTRRADAREKAARQRDERADEPAPTVEARKAGPLGRRPLRAAVEDGWPDTRTTAIVARGGALARVALADGAVVALVEDAYPERRASCHAARLGLHGIGFLCGEREGPTVVYELVPPLALKQVLRFDKPRFISASGNGALVIRGRCEASAVDEADARWYCVRSPAGASREVRVEGFDLGVERVIGLGDGRVAVLVPPRGGSPGDLAIVSVGGQATRVTLKLPDEPAGVARELKRGLWLDGFEERAPGVLGGWVEAGGPVVGVRLTLDGAVKAGELQGEAGGAVFGGRFAVLLLDGQRALETTDGGMTWAGFDLPTRLEEARAVPTRAAGPVGAALPGWIRVGWGEPEAPDDMKPAEEPTAPYVLPRVTPTIALDCEVGAPSTPPLPDKPRTPAPVVAPSPRHAHRLGPVTSVRAAREAQPGWASFRNTMPPALAADEYGIDNGNTHDAIPLRAYAWGKRGADWSRAGRWLLRFDDRFDPAGGVRAAALTSSPWADEAAALEAIGSGISSYGAASWAGLLDPSGHALLAAACRGSGTSCQLYAVGDGHPVLPLRDAAGRPGGFVRPTGAVRLGETWFFLGQGPSSESLTLWRVELGAARPIGSYFRSSSKSSYDPVRLVRRALGGGVGLLVSGAVDPGDRHGSWYVLPVSPDTGELGEAVVIGRRDFGGASLARCAPEQDGWLLDVTPDTAVSIDLDNARAQLDAVEMRVRLDPGRACVDAFAARSGPVYPIDAKGAGAKGAATPLTAAPGRKGAGGERDIPLAATEKSTGRRWGMSCRVKPRR